jgi:hypothetical protein
VTVISGNIGSSHGETFEKKGELLKPGSLWVYPAKHRGFSKFSSSVLEASITSTLRTIRARSSSSPRVSCDSVLGRRVAAGGLPGGRAAGRPDGPIGRHAAGRFRVASRKFYRDQINRLIKLELWSVQTIFEFS